MKYCSDFHYIAVHCLVHTLPTTSLNICSPSPVLIQSFPFFPFPTVRTTRYHLSLKVKFIGLSPRYPNVRFHDHGGKRCQRQIQYPKRPPQIYGHPRPSAWLHILLQNRNPPLEMNTESSRVSKLVSAESELH